MLLDLQPTKSHAQAGCTALLKFLLQTLLETAATATTP
jgi:hypothetical protein